MHHLLSYWDFHARPILGFTKNGVKREKHPVCGSPVGENVYLFVAIGEEEFCELVKSSKSTMLYVRPYTN